MTPRQVLTALGAVFALAAGPASAGFLPGVPGETLQLPTRPGVTERYAAFAPDGAPQAAGILLVGGQGVLKLAPRIDPNWGQHGNFLVRIRENLRRRGVYVAIIDVPSDHSNGLGRFRTSQDHAEDIAAIIADVRRRAPGVPVWLIGTSMGTISAADGAARLPGARGPDGIVLTSAISRVPFDVKQPPPTVLDVDLSAIRVPTLVVYHRADACDFVAPADAQRLLGKLANVPRKEAIFFDGGDPPRSTACEALAAHGYFGIEGKVADAIADWILAEKH